MVRVMKKIIRRLKNKLASRKLEKLVDDTAASIAREHAPAIAREAHEREKLGCCTVTFMGEGSGAKRKLRSRLIDLEAQAVQDRVADRSKAVNTFMEDHTGKVELCDESDAQKIAEKILDARLDPSRREPPKHQRHLTELWRAELTRDVAQPSGNPDERKDKK